MAALLEGFSGIIHSEERRKEVRVVDVNESMDYLTKLTCKIILFLS